MRLNYTLIAAAAVAVSLGVPTARAAAQALGPQRQFLAVEPYYESTHLDRGASSGTENANGYGARLWVNGAPFHFPLNSSIALFASYSPEQTSVGQSTWYYGGQVDQFFVRRPLAGIVDPFISVGAGAYHVDHDQARQVGDPYRVDGTRFALSPGGGIRIPIPNRFELRGDVKDLMIFHDRDPRTGESRMSNNLLIQAGLGLTF